MVYSGDLELDEALFSIGSITLDGVEYPTPLKGYPAKKLLETEQSPKSSTRNIAELYCGIDTTDLEDFELYIDGERDDPPNFVEERLEDPLEQIDAKSEIVVVFFEIAETRELGPVDIRRYLKLSQRYSDIVVMPHQWGLVRRIFDSSGRMDPDVDLPEEPLYTAYYNGVTRFLLQSDSIDKPCMGILPLFGESHKRNEHIEDFSEANLDGICIDFKNRHPDNIDELPVILDGIQGRGRIENTILYALNPPYTSEQNQDGSWIAEDFLLATRGFDVIGELHFGFPSSNGPIEDIRVFNKDIGSYQDIDLNQLWKVCGDSGFSDRMLEQNPEVASDCKRLLSCEQIQMEFRKLRDAIESENSFEYLRSKEGIGKDVLKNISDFETRFIETGSFDRYSHS